jgi:hypothetical protein
MATPSLSSRIEFVADGCWLWTGSLSPTGYGERIRRSGNRQAPHRVVYELMVGPIPEGLVIDHLCRVRNCVNPAHLEPVTQRENTMRSPIAPAAVNAAAQQCRRGHPFDEANTYVDPNGYRGCRACRTAAARAHKERTRVA